MVHKILTTERLLLRPLTPEDAQAAFVWCGDERVNRYMNYPLYHRVEDVREWLKTLDNESNLGYDYGFVVKETGELIGSGGMYYHEDRGVWSFGYNLRFDRWNHGYTTEAMQAIIDYVRSEQEVLVIEAEHALENPASGRVMEKLGLSLDRYGEYSKLDNSAAFKAKIYRRTYAPNTGEGKMRTTEEMMGLILRICAEDDRIRAAWLGGSRCNPNAPQDIFQDYDIDLVVGETKSFREKDSFIDKFGERLYLQYPENELYQSDVEHCYGWLIQFADGIRLDLHVSTLPEALSAFYSDHLTKVLIDKDNCLSKPEDEKAPDSDFYIKKPSETIFQLMCNEFWWCTNNLAKGIWREEYPYALDMLNLHVRPILQKLLDISIGFEYGFDRSTGKSGKYMKNWLSPEVYGRYLKTYCGADICELKEALFLLCDLMDETALKIEKLSGYPYNRDEAEKARKHLFHVIYLPKDATSVY